MAGFGSRLSGLFGGRPSPLNARQVSAIDAKTQNFKNALTAYKNAIGNLNANANIYAKLNNKNKNGTQYSERLLKAIAQAFSKSENAAAAVKSLELGAPEGPAADEVTAATNAVNDVAARIAELNRAMTAYGKLNNANVNAYITNGRNASANNLLNKNRTGGRKYGNFFTRVVSRKITKAGMNKALAAQPSPVINAVAAGTNNFANKNVQTLIAISKNQGLNNNTKSKLITALKKINSTTNVTQQKNIANAIRRLAPTPSRVNRLRSAIGFPKK
jgi:hypothetical protein